jgi:hypothetical protein
MPTYQVAAIDRPKKWTPQGDDDVPLELHGQVEILAESEDVFAAVQRAEQFNRGDPARQRGRWAVVVEPGGGGRIWPAARVVTPLSYKVAAIWWPDGWEPTGPLDVPNCVFQLRDDDDEQTLTRAEAEAAVLGLNRQCMDHPGECWYVVAAVENEPLTRKTCSAADGTETTVETRRMHVCRPAGGGRGDCSHCPAFELPCAREQSACQTHAVSRQTDGPADA